jgi:hypothetical protein
LIFVVAAAKAIVRPMMPVDTLAVSADPQVGHDGRACVS